MEERERPTYPFVEAEAIRRAEFGKALADMRQWYAEYLRAEGERVKFWEG